MDRVDFFYRQRVTQAELDGAFDDVEEAIVKYVLAKHSTLGIAWGLLVWQTAPNSSNVNVDYGRAFDKAGVFIPVASMQLLSTLVDENGDSTAVVGVGNERWLSVFLKADRVLSDPRIDGNGATVYYQRAESFELIVRMAAEQPLGTGLLPTNDATYPLLADVQLKQGTTDVLSISLARTEYLLSREMLAHQSSATPSIHDADQIDDETVGGYHAAAVQGTLDNLSTDLVLLSAEMTTRERIQDWTRSEDFLATTDVYGIILPFMGIGAAQKWGEVWKWQGFEYIEKLAADGEALWQTCRLPPAGGGLCYLRKHSRQAFVLIAEASGLSHQFLWGAVATQGGNVYTANDVLFQTVLQARNRTTCEVAYEINTAHSGTVFAIATDGYFVAIAIDNWVEWYYDDGAQFVFQDSYDHTGNIYSIAMDGQRMVIGGADDGAGHQIEVIHYSPAGTAVVAQLSRAAGPAGAKVTWVDFDCERILWIGDVDAGAYGGCFRSYLAAASAWTFPAGSYECRIVEQYAVFLTDGTVFVMDLETGAAVDAWLTDGGVASPGIAMAWDGDALFILNEAPIGPWLDHRWIRRHEVRTMPALYARCSVGQTARFRALHSLLQRTDR